MRDPVETYLSQLRDIHASGAGVAETSYYGPLAALLDEIGRKLKPRVTAVINLRNTGAGIPDGGLFTAQQLKGVQPGIDPLAGQLPARGALEVKGAGADAFAVARSEQVARYVERYGLVLVTNLRDFVLVGRNVGGSGVRELESCRLSASEAVFWAKVQQPRTFAHDAGEGLTEFLQRVLLHNAPLADPKDLAWFLASYARTARLRLEQRHESPALAQLRGQLEASLGLEFKGEKGDHFFRSTLVQTLFYGMFASWVLWARDRDNSEPISWESRFQWETATATLHVPMVYELFRQFADVRQLGALGISEVLEWAEEVFWRIDRAAFFEKFREEHAVQYFYEPFLEAFDPQLRKELGVWYTPDEVVKYMVARVDWALREELGIADGLADPSVVVLDPCCGTGAYLVEVLRKIDETLQAKGADALTRQDVKRAAMERVIGFEIMPAPFVVAHLQLGILLAGLGVPLRDADERAAVYLTNALTGWGDGAAAPPREKHGVAGQMHSTLLFPEFAEERDAADRIKREEKILVVIGNPPYNSYAGTSPVDEEGLIDVYKQGLVRDWGVKKFNLDDLYVRFFRLAERQITERTGRGIVCLISNFSWTSGASYVVMRERFLKEFDAIWIDSLNGDSRETGKLTPDGAPDPSVFSTDRNREGIRVGTAIALMLRKPERRSTASVRFRDFWGATKRADLVASLSEEEAESGYASVTPSPMSRYSLRPGSIATDYLAWPKLTDLCAAAPINGLMEKRGGALFDIDAEKLERRMRAYFDPTVEWAELEAMGTGLTRDAARFEARAARAKVLATEGYRREHMLRYAIRPFEDRWAYFSSVRPLWNEPRPALFAQVGEENAFLLSRVSASVRDEGVPFYFTAALFDDHLLSPDASCFTFLLPSAKDGQLDLGTDAATANLSAPARGYLSAIGLSGLDERSKAGLVWQHALAIGCSPAYLRENADGVKQDWPRIPLPGASATLMASASLGATVARLFDPKASEFISPHEGSAIRELGSLSSASGILDPAADLAVTARWGIAGKGGICMPSTGKLTERGYAADELSAIEEHAATLGITRDEALALLGRTCFDVYLNDVAYWRCVPANVWRYTIGGYQVIKKWLSYRELALLGRGLKPEEARYVTEMVRRIAALVLMQPELDADYERVKADVWKWER